MIAAALVLIASATLLPASEPGGGWDPARPGLADLALNVALFLPLGLALRSARRAGWRVLAAALSVSLTIEVAQLLIVPGRTSSPWDMVANATGAWAGASLPFLLLATPMALAWLLGPVLLAPAAPAASRWWGQWAHHFPGSAPFSGGLVALEFNGIATPDRQLSVVTTDSIRSGYATPPITVRVLLRQVSDSSGLRHIASIADGQGQAVLALWQRGTALEASWFARGTALGLRTPAIRAEAFLAGLPNGRITLQGWAGAGTWRATLTGPSLERRTDLRLGPWQGWRLLWPLPPPTPGKSTVISLAWTILGLGPLLLALAGNAIIKGTNRPPTGPSSDPSSRR